ncbi:uncharacterized protein LOC142620426 [Castanea sativa]|uniref:uncharacterized protein LOC142620426 n=1 Tax=Castanea sativa TaxID=21020 RepID=UPI003F649A38
MTILAWNCRGLRSALAVRTLADEVQAKDPSLIFVVETKTGESRMKGIRNKLEYTQGITVPSDGRSGGLAMMWKEGSNIRFRSCSNSHIDVEVHENSASNPWRATGFYGHPDAGKRFISWQLLENLKNQYFMPWIVFGDFNEITQSNEKIGWLDRDANQMEEFRETILGVMGGGAQRTKVRLDCMVAPEGWMRLFPEARVRHVAMSISDHCMLMLTLERQQPQKRGNKRFFFKAMWTRDERCKEIVEEAWEPGWAEVELGIGDRIKRCQENLQAWNWKEFGHVYRVLKQKKEMLQQLEC